MKVKNFFKRFFAGMGIGVGAAIPGVSGAAIAVIFKVYEDIISAVNSFRKRFGYALKVLIPILLGIICAVIPCIFLFSFAFEHFLFLLISLFAGFLIGSFPGVTDEVKGVRPNTKQIIIIVVGALFVIALGVLSVIFGDTFNLQGLFDEMPWWLYLVLIPVGALAAVALTVPGLSGSLILLIIGFYRPLVDHAKEWASAIVHGDFSHIGQLLGMIGCFAVGCLIGVVLVSKIMTVLLKKSHDSTFFGIIGFILGSVVVLFFNYESTNYYKYWLNMPLPEHAIINPYLPWWVEIIIGVFILAGATFGSYMLVRTQRKHNQQSPMDETVLCYIKKDDEYLLLYRNKEKDDINQGKYVGVGGHLEKGETKEEALLREVKEETGLELLSYQYHAKLLFINDDYKEIMHLYTSDEFKGELIECNEGELVWIKEDEMLKVPHWEGDHYFLDKMLNQKEYFEMTLIYKDDKLIKVIDDIENAL